MIKFKRICQETPYLVFKKKYKEALDAGQKNIEAISVSSYNSETDEVDSRFVNLKSIDKKNFIHGKKLINLMIKNYLKLNLLPNHGHRSKV